MQANAHIVGGGGDMMVVDERNDYRFAQSWERCDVNESHLSQNVIRWSKKTQHILGSKGNNLAEPNLKTAMAVALLVAAADVFVRKHWRKFKTSWHYT